MAKENDLKDNRHPKNSTESTPANMDLPEMHDIPGQENIQPAPLGELADTTASSDDEEGKGVLDEQEQLVQGESNVTEEERRALENAATRDPADIEEKRMHKGEVDMTDDEGEPLNEGEELDVPGSEADDAQEETGSEDEENNEYSIDKND